ncbi:hypothetical protein JW979_07120 [bacterium]|nr:hypothetical protein [candidate division CSSED10-310 bacterium]
MEKTVTLGGKFLKQIDSKGRLSIPKKLRDAIAENGDEIVIMKLDGCLQLLSTKHWVNLQERIEHLSPFDERTRFLQRFWGMQMETASIDSEGRIILTSDQKIYAGINKDVVIVGAINKLELWAAEKLETLLKNAPSPEAIANEIAKTERRQ